ncbi:MAG: hypothetical protein AAGD92_10620 [Pseudomonadota bacterium]
MFKFVGLISTSLVMIMLSTHTAYAASKTTTPLFKDDEVLKVKIIAPFKTLTARAQKSTDPYEATLSVDDPAKSETHAISLSARGVSRRSKELCDFPPLRVEFSEKPGDTSLFDGQKRLKLVTHCKRSERFQQYYLLEYTAYRLYNLMTPRSLKVRMAEITYIEEKTGKERLTRLGFFIEDIDDAAARNGLEEIEVDDIARNQIAPSQAGPYAVFQYMIGNLDWSMHSGPDGDDCCHNTKLIGAPIDNSFEITPVPYDFDYSGLVDAPYAAPPDSVRVRNVRQRRFRGFCAHNEETMAAAKALRARKAEFLTVIEQTKGMRDAARLKAANYLESFFDAIETDEKIEKNLLSDCRS